VSPAAASFSASSRPFSWWRPPIPPSAFAATVMDADTIYATGAMFSALPRGGVRVMVPAPQLDAALRLRERYDAGEFAIDEDFDVGPPDPEIG